MTTTNKAIKRVGGAAGKEQVQHGCMFCGVTAVGQFRCIACDCYSFRVSFLEDKKCEYWAAAKARLERAKIVAAAPCV